jgi:hypothetical protein
MHIYKCSPSGRSSLCHVFWFIEKLIWYIYMYIHISYLCMLITINMRIHNYIGQLAPKVQISKCIYNDIYVYTEPAGFEHFELQLIPPHIYIYIYMYLCRYICTYICMYMHIYACFHCPLIIYSYIYIYIYIYMYTYIYI